MRCGRLGLGQRNAGDLAQALLQRLARQVVPVSAGTGRELAERCHSCGGGSDADWVWLAKTHSQSLRDSPQQRNNGS